MEKKTGLEKYEVDNDDEFTDEVGIPKWGVFLALSLIGVCLIFAVLGWGKSCPVCEVPECPACELECPECPVCPSCPTYPQCPEFNCPDITWPNFSNTSCPDCICNCGDIIFMIPAATPTASPTATTTP